MTSRPVVPIAVAVATVDRAPSLARCLDALLASSVRPAELLVVDQGGASSTADLVEARRSDFDGIRHVVRPRRGLAASRNTAIAETTAPFVAFTDDDCITDTRWLEVLARTFERDPAPDAVTGRVLPSGTPSADRVAVSTRASTVAREFRGRARAWDAGTGANLTVRREWLSRLGGFDERLGVGTRGRAAEDMDLLHRLLVLGARVRYEPDAIVFHERASAGRRLSSRFDYGVGMGAFCALTLRRRDLDGLSVLGAWLGMRGRVLAGAVARGRRVAVREELLVCAGTARGLAYGLTTRSAAGR